MAAKRPLSGVKTSPSCMKPQHRAHRFLGQMAVGQNQSYHFGVGAPPILAPIFVGIGMFTGSADFDPWPTHWREDLNLGMFTSIEYRPYSEDPLSRNLFGGPPICRVRIDPFAKLLVVVHRTAWNFGHPQH